MLPVLLWGVISGIFCYVVFRRAALARVGAIIIAMIFAVLFSAFGIRVAITIGDKTADFQIEEVREASIVSVGGKPMIFMQKFEGYDFFIFIVLDSDGKPVLKWAEKSESNIVEGEADTAYVREYKLRYTGSRLWILPRSAKRKFEFSVPVGTFIADRR